MINYSSTKYQDIYYIYYSSSKENGDRFKRALLDNLYATCPSWAALLYHLSYDLAQFNNINNDLCLATYFDDMQFWSDINVFYTKKRSRLFPDIPRIIPPAKFKEIKGLPTELVFIDSKNYTKYLEKRLYYNKETLDYLKTDNTYFPKIINVNNEISFLRNTIKHLSVCYDAAVLFNIHLNYYEYLVLELDKIQKAIYKLTQTDSHLQQFYNDITIKTNDLNYALFILKQYHLPNDLSKELLLLRTAFEQILLQYEEYVLNENKTTITKIA